MLQDRGGHRGPLQAGDRVHQRVRAARRRRDALPRGQEPPERGGVDGLDLLAERRERTAAQATQHVHVAPFALARRPAGTRRARHARSPPGRPARRGPGPRRAQPRGRLAGQERRVRPGVAGDQRVERTVGGLGEHGGEADREGHAERIPKRRGVLDRRQSRFAGHAHPHGPAFGEHLLDPRGGVVLRPRARSPPRSGRRR